MSFSNPNDDTDYFSTIDSAQVKIHASN